MARLFNGSTDKISAVITDFISADFTFFAWIKPTAAAGGAIVRAEIAGGTAQQLTLQTGFFPAMTINYDTVNSQTTSSVAVTSGAWSLVVGTHTFSTKLCRIYIGTLSTAMAEATYSTQTAGSVAAATGTNGLVIGNRTSGALPYTGTIAACGVYTRNIAISEMDIIRAGHIPTKNLQYFWPLTDASASTNYELISGASGTATGTTYDGDPLPIALPSGMSNYQFGRAADGMSFTEKVR